MYMYMQYYIPKISLSSVYSRRNRDFFGKTVKDVRLKWRDARHIVQELMYTVFISQEIREDVLT